VAYKSGKCWSCRKDRPVESHHLHPLEYGGEQNGEQQLICADCHNVLHKEAEFYYKHGHFQDLDRTIPFQPGKTGERIRQLIAVVVKAKQAFMAGEINAGEQRRMTQISWDNDEEHLIAHEVKRRMKFKSLERAIKHLIFEKYQQLK